MLVGMAVANNTIVLNSDGKSWRPNLHILDVCQAVRCAIELRHNSGELLVLNVGANEDNLQVIEIANMVRQAIPGCDLKFLNENPELDKEGLIRDRKVKQGEDTRTYKVSFDKIKKVMPDFSCAWNVKRGIEDMVAKLKAQSFTNDVFKRRGFYRLQQLEHLHQSGLLSDDLFWTNDSEVK
jgi:nucleoside-diphosphate-sugar epimerase